MRRILRIVAIAWVPVLFWACGNDGGDLAVEGSGIQLTALPSSETGVIFRNDIQDRGGMNIFVWNFLYTGSGVAAGDVNGDGLVDLYFGRNQGSDVLYINKGNFRFEDATLASGISDDQWTTGVTMADVNADGHLDIYVCKNSPQAIPARNTNRLWINDGTGKFTEQAAQYGLADPGFSIQASFFDCDNDGDLDAYVINQPFDEFARLIHTPQQVASYPVTDRLYINQNGRFMDMTQQLGVPNAKYGLGVSLADFDLDGWTDLYISNDYHQGDQLLMNRNGKLVDELDYRTGHTAFYAMGSDVGDINNDGWQDVISIDMAFEDHYRSKTNMGSMQPEFFQQFIDDGQHYQYAQNALQLNTGFGHFIEIAQVAGVSKTDWSWAPLFADLNVDGYQDLLVTNGIVKDIRNNDYQAYVQQRYQGQVGPSNYLEILDRIPSTPVTNKLYLNNGDLSFSDRTEASGFDFTGFSQGMTLADLDGDGDQDIVLNNSNAEAVIYRNDTRKEGKSFTVQLSGKGGNTDALGATVIAHAGSSIQTATVQTSRGYMSSVPPEVLFTVPSGQEIDSIRVIWDNVAQSVYNGPFKQGDIQLDWSATRKVPLSSPSPRNHVQISSQELPFEHAEIPYDDYADQVLLPYKLSQNGPFVTVGDINNDGLEDAFIGGASGQAGSVLLQSANGDFSNSSPIGSKEQEQMQAVLLDVDNDGIQDIYVSSGSNEFEEGSSALTDELFMGGSNGNFNEGRTIESSRINGQVAAPFDMDNDGDLDLFIGGRLIGGSYPQPANSMVLTNDNGQLQQAEIESLDQLGLITGAVVGSEVNELVVVGEWMAPTRIAFNNGNAEINTISDSLVGLWWTIEAGDFNNDGKDDYLLGNLGWNNKFGSRTANLSVIAGDIDGNGDHDVVLAKEKNGHAIPVRGRECSSEEMPFILNQFPTYDAFAKAELSEILPTGYNSRAVERKINTFSSVLLLSTVDGGYTPIELPTQCQTGPIKAFATRDINGDGNLDFVYAGNHYPVEVETARYDGLRTGLALGNGKGEFTCLALYDEAQPIVGDFRDADWINTPDGTSLILTRNDDTPLLVKFKE